MPEVSPEFYTQVSESIKLVFDLTSRIDERVKLLVEHHQEINAKMEKLMDRQENISTRISVLEARDQKSDLAEVQRGVQSLNIRVASLELQSQGHSNRWDKAVDFIFKLAVAVGSALLIWKMGLKP